MYKFTTKFCKRLIEFTPMGANIGRAIEECIDSKRLKLCVLGSIFIRLVHEGILIFPALYFMFSGFTFSFYIFLTYTLTYFVSCLMLTTIYDIFYVLNDYIFVKYEDAPSIRHYVKEVSIKNLLSIRLTYIVIFQHLCSTLKFRI